MSEGNCAVSINAMSAPRWSGVTLAGRPIASRIGHRQRVRVFHVLEADFSRLADVLRVSDHAQTSRRRLLYDGAQLVVRDTRVHLDHIDTQCHELPHIRPGLVHRLQRNAGGIPFTSVGRSLAGHKRSRAPDLAAVDRIPLREAPLRGIVRVCNGRHAIPQKHLRHVIPNVNVGVDQTGKHGSPVCPDDPRVGGYEIWPLEPTALIRDPSITITASLMGVLPVPSISVPPSNTSV